MAIHRSSKHRERLVAVFPYIIGCHINQRKVPYTPDISSPYIGSLEDK